MDLKIFAKTIEPEAQAQVERMAAAPIGQGSKIRIMPDCHAGAGCTIGTTMTITDKVCPNLVGVDIACGVMLAYTDIHFEDRLEELDRVIRHRIPCGHNVHDRPDYPHSLTTMHCWDALSDYTHDLAFRSLGTLGGGNHFIEAYKGGVLCVHTGSRNIGLRVANYYQDLAKKKAQEKGRPDLAKIEPKDRQAALAAWKASRKEMDDLAYLEGEDLENYLHDCAILNAFAVANRQVTLSRIVAAMGGRIENEFDTVHNYIDTASRILRKGAVSAEAGKLLAIPLNMRDGVLVCRGKGNPDWNNSAPHGAGRLACNTEINMMAMLIAGNDLGFIAEKRADLLLAKHVEVKMQIADELLKDAETDKELTYTKADMARRLKQILGPDGWNRCKGLFPLLRDYWDD